MIDPLYTLTSRR